MMAELGGGGLANIGIQAGNRLSAALPALGGVSAGVLGGLGNIALGLATGMPGEARPGGQTFNAAVPTTAPKRTDTPQTSSAMAQRTQALSLPEPPPRDTSRYTACYPACALDPNAAFGPNTGAAEAYSTSYEIVGRVLLAAEGVFRLVGWGAIRILPQTTRLRMFYDTLQLMKPARNADQALNLLSRVLNSIEDAHSGVEAVANPGLRYTGRMYPPMADNITRLANGGLEAVTKGQRIVFGPDGSIRIFLKKTGELIFSKAGL